MKKEKSSTIGYINAIRESKAKTGSYLTFGVTLLISILLIVFAIVPTVRTITKINKDIKEKEVITIKLKNKIEAISNLDNEYKDSVEQFETLPFLFPENKSFVLLLSNIDPIISRNGFTLNSISFDAYKSETYKLAPKVLTPAGMRISVKGDAVDLMQLLRDLENMPNYPVLESISFGKQPDEDGLTGYSLLFRIYDVNRGNFYE